MQIYLSGNFSPRTFSPFVLYMYVYCIPLSGDSGSFIRRFIFDDRAKRTRLVYKTSVPPECRSEMPSTRNDEYP